MTKPYDAIQEFLYPGSQPRPHFGAPLINTKGWTKAEMDGFIQSAVAQGLRDLRLIQELEAKTQNVVNLRQHEQDTFDIINDLHIEVGRLSDRIAELESALRGIAPFMTVNGPGRKADAIAAVRAALKEKV